MQKTIIAKYIDESLADFILMSILIESGGSNNLKNEDKIYINNLLVGLNIEKSRFSKLRQKVSILNDKLAVDQELNLESFFHEIYERISHQYKPHETRAILLHIHHIMKCSESFSKGQLETNIFKSKSGNYDLDQDMQIEKVIQTTSDEECRELLIEVSEKDWSQELENFRNGIIHQKVLDLVESEISANQENSLRKGAYIGAGLAAFIGLFLTNDLILVASLVAMIGVCTTSLLLMGGIGALVSAILGLLGLFLYSFILIPLMTSGGLIISKLVAVVTCAAIGSAVGAGLCAKLVRYQLRKNQTHLERPYREKFKEYVMMPNDLLRFWESKVEIYLREKKSRVQSRMKEASKTRTECLKILDELQELNNPVESETKVDLKQQAENMSKIVLDAQKVNLVLQKLEDSFASKIEELRVLVQRQEKNERDQYRIQELQGKIRRVIDKSQGIRNDWEVEKSNLQIQIQGMMNAFQSQLLHTKDFVEAEIILKKHVSSETLEHIENS